MSKLYKYGVILLALFVALAAVVSVSLASHAAQPQAAVNMNCTLTVPALPLTAQGLATPYLLQATDPAAGPCNEANPNQASFVQGAIFDPVAHSISLYNPLVIDAGTTPAVAPVAPPLPAGAIVALWFGSNANNVVLNGATAQGNCINGLGKSIFGQFSYCNAPAFFRAANAAVRAGQLTVPTLGTALDGKSCPTVRDFSIVDQDQSDNVTTSYLVNAQGQTAQNTTANAVALPTAIGNGSDNGLLVKVDKALGCTPYMAPDLANNGALAPSLPLNELSAAFHQGRPVAVVPFRDPMTTVNGNLNFAKTALYRIGVDQNPFAGGFTQPYCNNLYTIAAPRIFLDKQFTLGAASPMPNVGNSLFTFLASRLNATWTNLLCQHFTGKASPVKITVDANGAAIDATLNMPKHRHDNERD